MQPTVPFLSCTCLMRDILLIIWGASVVQWVSLPTLIPCRQFHITKQELPCNYNMFTIPVINIETNYQIIIAEQIATYIYSDHIQLQAGRYFCDPDKL